MRRGEMCKSSIAKGSAYVLAAAVVLAATGCAEKSTSKSANRGVAAQNTPLSPRGADRIQREVRHELVMLPYYGVFDNLAYRVNGSTVELYGQVTRPTLKSDAENVVKKIEGVEQEVNNIEVLPT